MKKYTVIILTVLFVVSCKCNQNNAKMVNAESVLIAKGNLYGAGAEGLTKQNKVIENQSDWEGLMSQMDKVNNVSDSFLETEIDFSKYTIIAVFNDVKGTGGHNIDLDISNTSENTLVRVNYTAPKGNATTVMTQPYYIARIQKNDLPIIFK